MHAPFYDRRFSPISVDACPMCGEKTTLALVEPHPTQERQEIHTYRCKKCGPAKSRIVVRPPNDGAPLPS